MFTKRTFWIVLGVTLVGLAAVSVQWVSAEDKDKDKEEEMTLEQLPAAVRATVDKETQGATILELEKDTEDGKVLYDVEFKIGDTVKEISVAPDGSIVKDEEEDEDEDGEKEDSEDEEGDDDDEEENEQPVKIEELPAAVKATFDKESSGAALEELEMETEDGKVVYEAEVKLDGKDYEICVAADGTLLEKKLDGWDEDDGDEDDDDDDDDDDKN